jgi:hypothetical protein
MFFHGLGHHLPNGSAPTSDRCGSDLGRSLMSDGQRRVDISRSNL